MNDEDIAALQTLLDHNEFDAKYDMNDDGKLDEEDLKKLTQYIDAGGEIMTTFNNLRISYNGGFGDGWNKFFAGLKYISDDTAVMSADEFKMMFIAQKLEQNGVISTTYEFGQTVGNMTPVIIASAAATLATSYFGGEGGVAVMGASFTAEEVGKMTAATLIFGSTYGKSKHDALVKGHDLETAIGYGVLSGLSEAGLETLLGSLPYVGNDCKNVFVAMFKEGLTESVQEYVGAVIGEVMLDEEIDISELTPQLAKAFLFGALLSGMGAAGKKGIKVTFNGLKYVLTSEQLMDYYDASIDPKTGENNGLSLQEYIEENVDPDSETDTSSSSVKSSPVVDTTPFPDGADSIDVMKQYNPNAATYDSWSDFVNDTASKRKKWQSSLSKKKYIDSNTGTKFTLQDVVLGYIRDDINSPGNYSLINTINRAKGATPIETINNLILKDSNGDPVVTPNGNYKMRFYRCFGMYYEYEFDPVTGNVFANGKGLNVDGSIGTIYDLLDRADSESKALHQALSGSTFDKDTIVRRGTTILSLEKYGISSSDSADVIYQKLTANGDVFVDEGFMSTSPTSGFNGDVQYLICAKKGSSYGNFSDYNSGEQETLLDYGSKFEIIAVRKDSSGQIYVFLNQI